MTNVSHLRRRRPEECPRWKAVPNVLWDTDGCTLPEMKTKKCPLATQALHRLQRPFRDKLPVQTRIKLHKDNAGPHTKRPTSEANGTTGSEIFSHPPRSPDFAPSEYQLFGTLKDHVAHRLQ